MALEAGDINNSVYYGAYILRYFNPFAFHCYYAGKETYVTFGEYLLLNSWTTILMNLIYKTGALFNNIRIINKIITNNLFDEKDTFMLAESLGDFFFILLTP